MTVMSSPDKYDYILLAAVIQLPISYNTIDAFSTFSQ